VNVDAVGEVGREEVFLSAHVIPIPVATKEVGQVRTMRRRHQDVNVIHDPDNAGRVRETL
jgi:hypothetical protein